MRQYARVVEVPEIEEHEKAYNHSRPISGLVLHQLRHLHAAEQSLPEKDQTGINITKIHTELEASKYIKKVMVKLHPQGKKTVSSKRRALPKAARRRPGGKRK